MKNSFFTTLVFTLLFAVISIFLISFHEMWRDELQAWLLARDSASVMELFANLKYEGHPGLWHLMLYPLTRIFYSPEVMQYLHVGIAATSIFVLIRWSPFTALQKILLFFNYFLFYEYSIISRNYAIGILLIFIICAIFPKRREYSLVVSSAFFFLSHTSLLGLIFAICFFLTIIFDELAVKGCDVTRLRPTVVDMLAIAITLVGFFTAIIQIIPPSDSGLAYNWDFRLNLIKFRSIYEALVGAYFPGLTKLNSIHEALVRVHFLLPNNGLSFWNLRLFFSSTPFTVLGLLIILVLIYNFCRFLISRPTAFFLYISVSFALLLFFYAKFSGSLRHHGFLFIALITSLWIYNSCETKIFFLIPKFLKSLSSRTFNHLISVLFFIHLLAGIIAGVLDYKYPFSAAKETAKFIKQNDLVDRKIIGETSFAASAVAGYIYNKNFYYADANRYGSFVRWDNKRLNNVDFDDLVTIIKKFAWQNNDVILVINRKIEDFKNSGNVFEKLFESATPMISDEKFYVYRFLSSAKK